MPLLAEVSKTKQWDKYDRQKLQALAVEGKVNIEDLAYENIDSVHERWFPE